MEYLPAGFGASWQARPNMVVRGAIGLYAYNDQIGSQGTGSLFGSSANVGDNTNGILPLLLLDQDGSVNDQGSYGSSINSLYKSAPTAPDALNGTSVHYNLLHTPPQGRSGNTIWKFNVNLVPTWRSRSLMSVATATTRSAGWI